MNWRPYGEMPKPIWRCKSCDSLLSGWQSYCPICLIIENTKVDIIKFRDTDKQGKRKGKVYNNFQLNLILQQQKDKHLHKIGWKKPGRNRESEIKLEQQEY